MDFFAHRRKQVLDRAAADGADTVLVTNPVSVAFLTGYRRGGALAVSRKRAALVTAERPADVTNGVEPVVAPRGASPVAHAVGLAADGGIGFEPDHLTVAGLDNLTKAAGKRSLLPIPGVVEAVRAIKDPGEVEHLKAAAALADRAVGMMVALAREADTEKDLADALEGYVRRTGAEATAFPPLVAVGDNGADPMHLPGSRPAGDGSKLLVRVGARTAIGYHSDITRVIRSPFQVAPTRRTQKERVGYDLDKLAAAVLAGRDAMLAAVKDGVAVADVVTAYRDALGEDEYVDKNVGDDLADAVPTVLGHGIGLEPFERPTVAADSPEVLRAGMVVVFAPALYLQDWGGVRLGELVLVTRAGFTPLVPLATKAVYGG